MILGRVICLSDLGNILAYYLDETTLLYKCKYYLCPGLINTKCIYTLHNSIFIPAFFICVQCEHRSSQFRLIPYLRVRWEDSPYICRLWWICIYSCITIIAISMTICIAYCCITTIAWSAVSILCRWNMLLVFELR